MNALLLYARLPVAYWRFQYTLRLIGKRASLPPLGVTAVVAPLPSHWHLRLVDLNVQDLGDNSLQWGDLVPTGGLVIQVDSIQETINRCEFGDIIEVFGGQRRVRTPEQVIRPCGARPAARVQPEPARGMS